MFIVHLTCDVSDHDYSRQFHFTFADKVTLVEDFVDTKAILFKPNSQCGHVTVSDEVSVLVLMKFRHQGAARLVTPAQVQFAQV